MITEILAVAALGAGAMMLHRGNASKEQAKTKAEEKKVITEEKKQTKQPEVKQPEVTDPRQKALYFGDKNASYDPFYDYMDEYDGVEESIEVLAARRDPNILRARVIRPYVGLRKNKLPYVHYTSDMDGRVPNDDKFHAIVSGWEKSWIYQVWNADYERVIFPAARGGSMRLRFLMEVFNPSSAVSMPVEKLVIEDVKMDGKTCFQFSPRLVNKSMPEGRARSEGMYCDELEQKLTDGERKTFEDIRKGSVIMPVPIGGIRNVIDYMRRTEEGRQELQKRKVEMAEYLAFVDDPVEKCNELRRKIMENPDKIRAKNKLLRLNLIKDSGLDEMDYNRFKHAVISGIKAAQDAYKDEFWKCVARATSRYAGLATCSDDEFERIYYASVCVDHPWLATSWVEGGADESKYPFPLFVNGDPMKKAFEKFFPLETMEDANGRKVIDVMKESRMVAPRSSAYFVIDVPHLVSQEFLTYLQTTCRTKEVRTRKADLWGMDGLGWAFGLKRNKQYLADSSRKDLWLDENGNLQGADWARVQMSDDLQQQIRHRLANFCTGTDNMDHGQIWDPDIDGVVLYDCGQIEAPSKELDVTVMIASSASDYEGNAYSAQSTVVNSSVEKNCKRVRMRVMSGKRPGSDKEWKDTYMETATLGGQLLKESAEMNDQWQELIVKDADEKVKNAPVNTMGESPTTSTLRRDWTWGYDGKEIAQTM